jgi:hypothetical protein
VHIHARVSPEGGCEPLGKAGLGELAAAPGRDSVALGSVWFEDGPHARFVSTAAQFLPDCPRAVGNASGCVANGAYPKTEVAMPWGDWINELPMEFFMAVHIAAFAIGAGFAWIAHTRGLSLLTWSLRSSRSPRSAT